MSIRDADLNRLFLLAKAFDCTSEALFITDAENRIVEANAAFTRLTGYSLDEVRGSDPSILASGRTSPETFAAMREALVSQDSWQGEVWDRRRDGSIFPKWLTISVVRSASGAVENYIASFSDITDRKDATEKLQHLVHHDPLTGLFNRSALEVQLGNALACAQRDNKLVATVLIDLDNFKQINDSLNHHVGDELLIQVAQRLEDTVRASDIVARLGGDEFAVILQDIDNALSVSGIASKLLRAFSKGFYVGDQVLYTTPSIGVALFPADAHEGAALLQSAESAMYHAKSEGKNNVQFFAPSMNAAAQERLRFENGLRAALAETDLHHAPQFRLYFQPQIDVASGRITGLEALARWFHPEWGLVPPNTFIPIAEETGLIEPLGDWVFWEACRKLREFKDGGMAEVRVAVNLSTQQLRHENLPIVVNGALACYDLRPSDLELEITESVAMHNPAATVSILEKLGDMGIVLAIDDFGTGYSSLAYLKHLPIHRLKLDRSFVKEIDTNRDDAAICSATIALGHNLGLDLVAEGVETEVQRDRLNQLGCDLLQGFLYSRPLPAENVVEFVTNWNQNAKPLR